MSNKVPAVALSFWVIKIMCTTVGETGADLLAFNLQALLVRPGAILSRSDLEDRIYGWGEEVDSNAVEFLIHSLRSKLGKDTIKNVRGAGWMVSKSA